MSTVSILQYQLLRKLSTNSVLVSLFKYLEGTNKIVRDRLQYQRILINSKFPVLNINSTASNNIVINVFNNPVLTGPTACSSTASSDEPTGPGPGGPCSTCGSGGRTGTGSATPGSITQINFSIQDQAMKLVDMDGSHTIQNVYESLDVHVGQCYSVLVAADKPVANYYMVISTRFTKYDMTSVAVVRYVGSWKAPSAVLLMAPVGWVWSLSQFRSFRWHSSHS